MNEMQKKLNEINQEFGSSILLSLLLLIDEEYVSLYWYDQDHVCTAVALTTPKWCMLTKH